MIATNASFTIRFAITSPYLRCIGSLDSRVVTDPEIDLKWTEFDLKEALSHLNSREMQQKIGSPSALFGAADASVVNNKISDRYSVPALP